MGTGSVVPYMVGYRVALSMGYLFVFPLYQPYATSNTRTESKALIYDTDCVTVTIYRLYIGCEPRYMGILGVIWPVLA